jgi:hypothetical protein
MEFVPIYGNLFHLCTIYQLFVAMILIIEMFQMNLYLINENIYVLIYLATGIWLLASGLWQQAVGGWCVTYGAR